MSDERRTNKLRLTSNISPPPDSQITSDKFAKLLEKAENRSKIFRCFFKDESGGKDFAQIEVGTSAKTFFRPILENVS